MDNDIRWRWRSAMMASGAVVAWVVALAFALPVVGAEEVAVEKQSVERFEAVRTVGLEYLLYLPPEYESKKKWPLLLFLHGSGERGSDLEKVKRHGPPKLIGEGKDFPFIVVSPQCPKDKWWEPHVLSALIEEVAARYAVDEDRVCCTGLSMGGFGTWDLAFYAPGKLAALVPICGGGESYWVERFAHIPVWAFHGGMDKGVPPERSEEMIEAVRKAGGNAKLTIYPEAGHNSWTAAYNDPDLYTWMLAQRRTDPPVKKEKAAKKATPAKKE